MQEFEVKLFRNHREGDWSVEINGKRYDSVSIEFVEDLVKRALNDAKQSLTEAAKRRPH
jgi:DNA-binding protein YbaB